MRDLVDPGLTVHLMDHEFLEILSTESKVPCESRRWLGPRNFDVAGLFIFECSVDGDKVRRILSADVAIGMLLTNEPSRWWQWLSMNGT